MSMNGYTIGVVVALVMLAYALILDHVNLFPLNDLSMRGKFVFRRALSVRYVPPLLAALLLLPGKAWLAWLAVLIAVLQVAGHGLAWGKPYLFGSPESHKRRWRETYGRTHRFLPAIRDHILPDSAHVVGGLLAVLLLATALTGALSGRTVKQEEVPVTAAPVETKPPAVQFAFTQAGQHPEQLLLDLIALSRTSLNVAVSTLTHDDIVKALIDAKARGVAVRVITDRAETAGSSVQADKLKLLLEAGVPVKENAGKGLMNLKMTVADSSVAAVGSFNYTTNAASVNEELLLIHRDAELARSLDQQFEAIWNDAARYHDLTIGVVSKGK
jgi:hypothetical protein